MSLRNLLLAIGILSLLGGLVLSAVWLNQAERPNAARPEALRQAVMVAARAIPAGTLLRPDDIAWRETDGRNVRAGNLMRGQVSENEFIGAIARREFAAGEALISSELVKPNERQFLAAVLKPGMRAVSFSVDTPQSAAGLILPGDQVDVILTQNFADQAADPAFRSVAETVLRDARIIAVDQTLSTAQPSAPARGGIGADTRAARTVTFEVTERQAERLTVASQLGRLQLSLRPLETAPAGAATVRETAPTWAADVSPALGELTRRKPQAGGGIESAVRRPPAQVE